MINLICALSSGLLLYGCSLIYGFSGSTNFDQISNNISEVQYGLTLGIVFILVGLAFKISAVPFHMWAPDVYQGSPTSVTIFFAILPIDVDRIKTIKVEGEDPGSPENPKMFKKFFYCTGITTFIFVIIYFKTVI